MNPCLEGQVEWKQATLEEVSKMVLHKVENPFHISGQELYISLVPVLLKLAD